MEDSWCVYIVECSDFSYYTGITNNLEKRLAAHNRGSASKYTRSRRPVTLKRFFVVPNRSEASKLESFLKKRSRRQKALIIEGGLNNV